MRTASTHAMEVHISATVLGKIAAVAGRDVPGVEDVEGVFAQPARWHGPSPTLRLCLTARHDADARRLASLVRKQVRKTVRTFTGVRLSTVDVDFVPRSRRPFN